MKTFYAIVDDKTGEIVDIGGNLSVYTTRERAESQRATTGERIEQVEIRCPMWPVGDSEIEEAKAIEAAVKFVREAG